MDQQLPLLPSAAQTQPPAPRAPVSPSTALSEACAAFAAHMQRSDFALNTIKSFSGDLSLLQRFVGPARAIGDISTNDLQAFMDHLRHGRGVPCSPKSYGRRLTALKVFFAWLASTSALPHDPAAGLIHLPAPTASPIALTEEQIQRTLDAARALERSSKTPDPRPLFLISLLLQTGIKKGECLGLKIDHFDLSDPKQPAVYIRYREPRYRHKERKLALEPGLPALLRRYVASYRPVGALFPCTGRNLEYVLHRVAQLAGLDEGLSFDTLRWTCALRDYRSGHDPEHLRRKLGLSKIAWEDTLKKLQALAAKPL
ncbi:MAG: tyrosine-type recombinase/integrase [Anaerolineae bacterium]